MAKLLVDSNNPVLRSLALPVPLDEIKSDRIQGVIKKMKEALHAEEDGVAIAAPQIGEGLRIFVVNSSALSLIAGENRIQPIEDAVYINPEITKLSKNKKKVEEGCLSLRWLYGEVMRHEKAAVRAYNENGKVFEKGASGLLAQVFQHEIDHLDGVLFIDKARNVENLPPREQDNITESK
jgi:peptide deformylase